MNTPMRISLEIGKILERKAKHKRYQDVMHNELSDDIFRNKAKWKFRQETSLYLSHLKRTYFIRNVTNAKKNKKP